LLAALSDEERRDLLRRARRRRFGKNEVVFHEGDPADAMHLVAKGHLSVRVTTPLGDTATLLILKAGDFVGEMAVVSPAPRNATVIALSDVETLAVHKDTLDELRAQHPAIDRVLIDALVSEVRRLSALLLEALYVPVDKRTWRRLLDLAAIYGSGAGHAVIPLTQGDLAQLVGTTRPTLNKLLRSAEEDGFIRSGRGRLEIANVEALARRAR
jgi:CRP-like cAMP-binding protein